MIKVSVVIPAYNAARTIPVTLEACLNQSYPKENYEVIVVDDGSADTTAGLIKGFPVKYLFQENRGPATARNHGWKSAEGEIVVFTDSDCVPEKDWLLKTMKMFEEAEIAAAGGTYGIMNPESLVASCIHYEIQYRHSTLPDYVEYLGSFYLAIKKNILDETGGFDESFRIACAEDADLTYRIAGKHYKMRFTRDSKVSHFFPTKFSRYLKQQYYRGFWLMKLFQKHPGRLGNDKYSRFRDAIQPPLYFLLIVITPFIWIGPLGYVVAALHIIAVLIHIPVVSYSYKISGNPKLFFLFIMLYLRGFSWAFGCFTGFFKFVLLKQKS
ncbi:MAG: glycosyltransferase [Bacteroidota bacterium]